MNKAQIIDQIAHDAKITKTSATMAIDCLITNIGKTLKRGEKITLVGFGTFAVSKRKARTGRNPQTGETIKIKAKNVARFKPGKELEQMINSGR